MYVFEMWQELFYMYLKCGWSFSSCFEMWQELLFMYFKCGRSWYLCI